MTSIERHYFPLFADSVTHTTNLRFLIRLVTMSAVFSPVNCRGQGSVCLGGKGGGGRGNKSTALRNNHKDSVSYQSKKVSMQTPQRVGTYQLAGALNPVNHKGLYQGRTQTLIYLPVIHSTSHHHKSLSLKPQLKLYPKVRNTNPEKQQHMSRSLSFQLLFLNR